jgi:hypothetical protein
MFCTRRITSLYLLTKLTQSIKYFSLLTHETESDVPVVRVKLVAIIGTSYFFVKKLSFSTEITEIIDLKSKVLKGQIRFNKAINMKSMSANLHIWRRSFSIQL